MTVFASVLGAQYGLKLRLVQSRTADLKPGPASSPPLSPSSPAKERGIFDPLEKRGKEKKVSGGHPPAPPSGEPLNPKSLGRSMNVLRLIMIQSHFRLRPSLHQPYV